MNEENKENDIFKIKETKIKNPINHNHTPLQKDHITPKHPYRALVVGASQSGKTQLILHLFNNMYLKPDKSFYFDKFILLDGSGDNTFQAFKFLEPKNHYTDTNEFLDILNKILKTQKKIISDVGFNKSPRVLVVLEDLAGNSDIMKKSKVLKDFFIKGRHYNISSVCVLQYLKCINPVCRANATNIILFNTNLKELEKTVQESGSITTIKKTVNKLKMLFDEPYNFIHINNQVNITKRYREKFNNIITFD